jgi:3-methyladenine DNA glycosylase/8-oxoguanine DNA glycosylase
VPLGQPGGERPPVDARSAASRPGPPDRQMPDGRPPDRYMAEGRTPDGHGADGRKPDGHGADGRKPDGHRADGHMPDEQSRDWHAPFPLSLRLTLSVHRRGPGDPTLRVDDRGAFWRTSLTPDGPGTLRLTLTRPDTDLSVGMEGALIRASAWGSGASWLLDTLPDLLGAADDPAAFRPDHPRLRELARQLSGLRISRTARVLEALVPAVLEQKVVGVEAHRAWRRLVRWYGSPAPGPAPAAMRVVPAAATLLAIPSWDWHRAGVEAVRARTIANAASVAERLESIATLPAADADRMLRSLPGIGPWTSAEVRQRACGDGDAVSVGDYHIPALVGWNLAGRVTDDAGMLELLAPYAGQRYRVTRLLELGGQGPPRRGPRMSVREYRAF